MVLADERHARHPVRAEQRQVDHVLRLGYLLGQIGRGHVHLGETDGVRFVRRGIDSPAVSIVIGDDEANGLEIAAGVRLDPVINRLPELAAVGDLKDRDVLARHAGNCDQLSHQRNDHVRARQPVQRFPPERSASSLDHGGVFGNAAPLGGPVLVAVDLDGDLLSRAIPRAALPADFVEVPEQRIPSLLVVLPAGQILEQLGCHPAHGALVSGGIVPPEAGRSIPTGRGRVSNPNHPAWVDAFAFSDRAVGRLAGLKRAGLRRGAALLRHRARTRC